MCALPIAAVCLPFLADGSDHLVSSKASSTPAHPTSPLFIPDFYFKILKLLHTLWTNRMCSQSLYMVQKLVGMSQTLGQKCYLTLKSYTYLISGIGKGQDLRTKAPLLQPSFSSSIPVLADQDIYARIHRTGGPNTYIHVNMDRVSQCFKCNCTRASEKDYKFHRKGKTGLFCFFSTEILSDERFTEN